jgi:hypothetical protein
MPGFSLTEWFLRDRVSSKEKELYGRKIFFSAFLQLPSLEKKRGVGGEFINPL